MKRWAVGYYNRHSYSDNLTVEIVSAADWKSALAQSRISDADYFTQTTLKRAKKLASDLTMGLDVVEIPDDPSHSGDRYDESGN